MPVIVGPGFEAAVDALRAAIRDMPSNTAPRRTVGPDGPVGPTGRTVRPVEFTSHRPR